MIRKPSHPRDWPLATKLGILLVLLAVVPLSAVTYVNGASARAELLAATRAQNLQVARSTAAALDGYLRGVLADIHLIAVDFETLEFYRDPQDEHSRAEANRALLRIRDARGFDALYLTDRNANVLMATDDQFVGRNYATAPYFLSAMAGLVSLDEPRHDPVGSRVYLHFSAPVQAPGGPIVGTAVGRTTMSAIYRIIAGDANLTGRREFGVLWDDAGVRLNHAPASDTLLKPFAPLPPDVANGMIAEARFGPETADLVRDADQVREVVDRSGLLLDDRNADPHLRFESARFGPLYATITPLKSKRWLYGIFTPEAAMLSASNPQTERALLAGAIAGLLATVAALGAARWVSRPIRLVASTANALAAGKLARRTGLRRRDEVGQLAAAFDAMADALVQKQAELQSYAALLEQRVEERTRHIQRLNRLYRVRSEVNQAVVRIRDRGELLQEACRIAVEHGSLRMAWVGFVDDDTLSVKPVARSGFDEGFLDTIRVSIGDAPEGRGPIGTAVRTGERFVRNDIERDGLMLPWQAEALGRGYRSSAAFPLRVGTKVVGGFAAYAGEARFFGSDEIQLLDELAADISFALESMERDARRRQAEAALLSALEELRERSAENAALLEGTRAILEHREFEAAARSLFDTCKKLVGAAAGYVALRTADGAEGEVALMDLGGLACTVDTSLPMPLEGLKGEACHRGGAVYRNDLSGSDWTSLVPPGHMGLDSVMFAPIVVEGKLAGLLGLANKAGGFTEKDARLVSAFADLVAVALRNRRTLERLEDSEERFRSVVQTAGDAIVCADADGNILSWNRGAETIFGYTGHEVEGKPFAFLIPERLRECYQQVVSRFVTTGEPTAVVNPIEIVGVRKDGSEVPLDLSLASWRTRQGVLLAGIAREVTERKRAEQALRESQERYRRLVELSPDAIAVHSEGKIVFANGAAAKLLGAADPTRLIGEPVMDFVHPDYHGIVRERVRQMRDEGREVPLVEEKFVRLDGTTVDVEVAAVALTYRGKPAVQVVIRDITERKLLAQQLLRAQRLEMAGRIAAQVAHDFNNLLVPMAAYPDLIKMRLPADHPAVPMCDAMLEAALQMAAINQDMMALGRRGHFDQEPTDLNRLVEQSLAQMPEPPETLQIKLDLAPDLLPVRGSQPQLLRVVTNLASNAREAMREVGLLTLETENVYVDRPLGRHSRVEVGEYVRLIVADTGTGIPPEIRDRIFDPFFTTKLTGKRRGSGLGLGIVQAIVEDHRGYIDVASEVGRGTTFDVYLPASRQAVAEEKPRQGLPGGSEAVLVVDDDQLQREAATRMLQLLGYRVEAVATGEEAVAYLKTRAVDLLILDMVMPGGIDGAETYRRALEARPGQRAILVSGYAESERVRETRALGAGPYLRKPVTLEKLARAVREEMERDHRDSQV